MAENTPLTEMQQPLPPQKMKALLVEDKAQTVLQRPARASIFLTVTVNHGKESDAWRRSATSPG